MTRTVAVTGIGIVSGLGDGIAEHLDAVASGRSAPLGREALSGYPVHPVVPLQWDRQIPKKADQRQMEPWQKLGVYAAGLALADAGLVDAALKADTQMIVAAGGGERDYGVDGQILTGLREAADPGGYLNEHLLGDIRPTLFLAQLSNLLAGNVAIVHGITGASRTFMGEEQSGVDALRIAQARIAAGQCDRILVVASYNAERPDAMLTYELGGFHWRGEPTPVRERTGAGGLVLGSVGAALLLEAADVAAARDEMPRAVLAPVVAGRSRREPGSVSRSLDGLASPPAVDKIDLVVSGASGIQPATSEEHDAIDRLAPGAKVLSLGDLLGHAVEAQAVAGTAIAAGLIASERAREALVTSVGHRRGEGLVRLSAAR